MYLLYRPVTQSWIQKLLPFLDLRAGPWIAGGAARLLWDNQVDYLFTDEPTVQETNVVEVDTLLANTAQLYQYQQPIFPVCDIDLFGYWHFAANGKPLGKSVNTEWYMGRALGYRPTKSQVYTTHNATTYKDIPVYYKETLKFCTVQYISRPYSSLTNLFANFDFVNCQFASDGKIVVATLEAVKAWAQQKLVWNPHCQQPLNLRRVVKYCSWGLAPTKDLTHRILIESIASRTTGIPHVQY